jgi:peptidoglycan hydrolase CwlO-like protein
MPSDPSSPSKSPFLAAIGISLAIAAGSIISTLDMATVEDVTTGRILTRPLAEAQQRHTLAIGTLENTVGAITRDIDFVASRVSATVHRSEEAASDRFAQLDAEIAALKDKIAGIQHARLAPVRVSEPQRDVT